MEDYKKKKMTKAQLWDKLHEERTMWINKCRNDVQAARAQAVHETLLEIRAITDPVLAAFALAFGKPDEDGEYVLEVKMPEAKEGFEWQARILVSEEGEWAVCAKEVKLPKMPEGEEEEAEEQEEEQ